VALNAIAYLLEIRHGGSLVGGPSRAVAAHYGATPYQLTHGHRPASVVTSLFVHASFLHLFGNMLFLALFGPTVEDSIGRLRFTAFYLLGGLLALACQIVGDPGSTVPALGASGAIAAVLGGYILLYPRARILSLVLLVFFVTIVEVPAVLLLACWFLEQLYVGLDGLAGVGAIGSSGEVVAYFAHIGGFAFGLLAIRLFIRRRRASPTLPVY
jgi:membrane associated rhomboid family serine protease